ncbi:MAG: YdcF family protein [Actinomycetota bacterium]|jgi:uncharacterized SAM-binding protein YcdF (DUF218 family)|nr:YdcF family protein [Rubrobacter sp.]MDQ3566674.1 YdcF family protein [Actinomycetota bacterium]
MNMRRSKGILRDLARLVAVYRGRPSESFTEDGKTAPRVAVILGAQVLSGGRPSRTLDARARHAAGLYADGDLDLLIPTGGLGEHPPSEAEVMAQILRAEGVPEDAILQEDAATSTWDSAVLVSALLRRRGMGEARAITDPLHCVRTVAAFREEGLELRAEPVYCSPMWREAWPRRGQLIREAGALIWYRMRHGVGARSRR